MKVLALTALLFVMSGCGNRLGAAWVTHNTTVSVVTQLNEAELISLADVKEFRSYQLPVLEGLNNATDDYLDGDNDFTQAELILNMIDPMLDRMLEIQESYDEPN